MLRMLIAIAAISQLVAQVDAVDLRVRTVDLRGEPVANIQVRIGNIETQSDGNGLATFTNTAALPPSGFINLQVNLSANSARGINPSFIGRVKTVQWNDVTRFESGFVIPLWKWGDVKSLGTAVVRNPDHVAVVIQYDKEEVSSTRVVAKSEGDAAAWIERWVPDLPAVTSHTLARSLYAGVAPGETVPQEFADEMANVYREVEQIVQTARSCRLSPNGPLFPQAVPPDRDDDRGDDGGDVRDDDRATDKTPTYPTPNPPTSSDPPRESPPAPFPPAINYRPPPEPDTVLQQVTTYKPVWETEYRDQQMVVRRAVQQPVWQDRCCVVYRPVTTQPPAYGCGLFSRGLPQTQMVPQVVTQRSLGYVTGYQDEVVTQKVPVQVRKMVAETRTIQVPRTQQTLSAPTQQALRVPMASSDRPVLPANQGVADNAPWVRVDILQ